ncbi:protein disulfide isomerase [Rhizopus microsporus ATCC 52813]|uniref:Protein disulfide-isomerase n=1 Tax=Rhizopus microsporus ATCC 52813 TaxID=1340429 RepID=A0A2G4T7M9_RHIZD|nr:protein disulfide isomerase [Rhizopus microsporus ATCC 52813]PHZ16998.1 protein disulfide isomerase [Rhizopus microsporus ATCC 52813]
MVKKSFLLAAIATTFSALTHTVLADSDVLSLTDKTFDQSVLGQDLMLVEFFAPWCGHCKALAPEYEKAATTLKSKNIPLAKVDCTENEDLCQKHDVRGYPTLKVFRKGEAAEYKGARKADGIVSYMEKQALPSVTEVTASNFDEFKKTDRVVIIAYAKDDASKETFQTLADKNRENFVFGLVTDEAVAKEHKVTEFPSLVVYTQFDDESTFTKPGEFKYDELLEFIKVNSVPLLDEIDASNFQTYAETGLPIAYLFHDNEESKNTIVKEAKALAEKYKGKINFVHIDAKKYGGHADNVGLKQQFPAFSIQHLDNGAKFPLDQTLAVTRENLERFVDDYVAGKIKPHVKSAEPPAENNGPVKVVVASQFKDIVLDKSKDVFLEVYAPWCGYCKKLEPIWTQLGQVVSQNAADSVVIAKMDGTENDIPEEGGFDVTGFPTLKFFQAETNKLIDYEGDRSMEDLVKFLNEHNSKGLKFEVPEEKKEEEKKDEKKDDEATSAHDEL